ncbi:hypothetical protein [Oryzobacter telluris]|uniref:hypothetical protein n=1 Tax=Oryzobacter telluris TaxID=3149179 RepID=UPI00370D45C4
MLIWGWGRKSRSRQLDAAQALFVNFGYFSLFFVFSVTWDAKYVLARVQPDGGWSYRDVTDAEATQLAGGGELPAPSPWQRFSLLGLVVVVVAFIALSAALPRS